MWICEPGLSVESKGFHDKRVFWPKADWWYGLHGLHEFSAPNTHFLPSGGGGEPPQSLHFLVHPEDLGKKCTLFHGNEEGFEASFPCLVEGEEVRSANTEGLPIPYISVSCVRIFNRVPTAPARTGGLIHESKCKFVIFHSPRIKGTAENIK